MIRYSCCKKLVTSTIGLTNNSINMNLTNPNNLAKLFSQSRPGDLLTSVGGAATHAYFQCQHMHLHHNQNHGCTSPTTTAPGSYLSSARHVHCSCVQNSGTGSDTGASANKSSNSRDSLPPSGSGHQLDPDVQAKLNRLKEKLAHNVYFEKYKQKFLRMELTSPHELLAKLEQLDAKPITTGAPGANPSGSKSHTKAYVLKDVMEVELLKDMQRDDIVYLWQEFHRKKDGLLAAVMSGTIFDKMSDLASTHNVFLVPLPRDDGYEFFFVQYMDKAFHFTPLLVYQTHKENAPECLRLINYTDLQASKDLVLMRGEYDKNLLTPQDAHVMAVQINFYYGETSETRKKLLETFSSAPTSFQHMDLIDELNKLKESHPHLFELEGSSGSA